MKSEFKFANLCGTVYRKGNVIFTPDGNSLISPVGNRISVFDLVNNTSFTFPFENRKNVYRIALHPRGTLLLSIDEDGHAILINYYRKVVLAYFNFKKPVKDAQFSPDGLYLAVTHGNFIQMWRTPGARQREFAPFTLYKTYGGHYSDVLSIQWSKDSKSFLTASKDMTAKVYTLNATRNEDGILSKALTLGGHKDAVVGAFWSIDESMIYTVSRDGACFVWKHIQNNDFVNSDEELEEDELQKKRKRPWTISARHYFYQNNAYLKSVAFHPKSRILVAGFSHGVFGLWEMPEFNNIHTLSITQHKISSIAINATGEWLAFGVSTLGQLLVWEWQSESYVLKQQGHFFNMSKVAYSTDGQYIATGGDDGKVKVWSSSSGFCFITFTEHQIGSSITGLEFAKAGRILFSASLDGTVRAFDLIRYRNFRTFTSPNPVQFASLAVDPSGEVVAAGSQDTFEVYLWSVQTGRLLDILSGHTGPVCSLAFSSSGSNLLASGSWDSTIRIWHPFSRSTGGLGEPFQLSAEVIAIAFRPDGNELIVSTLDGNVSFWNPADGQQKGLSIDGRRDVAGGRKLDDRMTAANNSSGKSFSALAYTADGEHVVAGGNSKYICVYDCDGGVLVRRFAISENRSLDGTQEFLNSKRMTEAGPLDLIDDEEGSDNDFRDRLDTFLPGTATGDLSKRRTRPEIRVRDLRFSPTGRSWAAATTEGLLIYSLDASDAVSFDPLDIDMDLTPNSVISLLEEAKTSGESFLVPLVSSIRLSEPAIIHEVFDAVPPGEIRLVARSLPRKYVLLLLKYLVNWWSEAEGGRVPGANPHVEFNLIWIKEILAAHGQWMRSQAGSRGSVAIGENHENNVANGISNAAASGLDVKAVLRGVQRNVSNVHDQILRLCDDNTYTLRYLMEASKNGNDAIMTDGEI